MPDRWIITSNSTLIQLKSIQIKNYGILANEYITKIKINLKHQATVHKHNQTWQLGYFRMFLCVCYSVWQNGATVPLMTDLDGSQLIGNDRIERNKQIFSLPNLILTVYLITLQQHFGSIFIPWLIPIIFPLGPWSLDLSTRRLLLLLYIWLMWKPAVTTQGNRLLYTKIVVSPLHGVR